MHAYIHAYIDTYIDTYILANICLLTYIIKQYVDDVLIDAPYTVTQEMINSLRIDVVVTGSFKPAEGR
jgi:hypothetical protein